MRASKLAVLTAAAALTAVAPAALAQTYYAESYVDEVIVQPRYGPDGPRTLSRAVGFDDLDLTSHAGREVLRLRIREAAGDLCRALGESPDAWSPLTRTCREQAIRSASAQMRMAVDQAYARSTYAYLDPGLIP